MKRFIIRFITFFIVCFVTGFSCIHFSWYSNTTHTHDFSSKTISAYYLKKEGNYANGNEYYYKCLYCPEKSDKTFLYGTAKEVIYEMLETKKVKVTGDTISDETQQGMAIDGEYAYIARVTDINEPDTKTLINRVNLNTGNSVLLKYDQGDLYIGVANDMHYVDSKLFIAPASYDKGCIYSLNVNGDTLSNRTRYEVYDEQGKEMTVSSITLKEDIGDEYVFLIRQNSSLYEISVPKNGSSTVLTATKIMDFSKPDKWPIEGIHYMNGKIITTVRDTEFLEGLIVIYDFDSKILEKTYEVPTDTTTSYYEIEAVGYTNGKWYINLNIITNKGNVDNRIEYLKNFNLNS